MTNKAHSYKNMFDSDKALPLFLLRILQRLNQNMIKFKNHLDVRVERVSSNNYHDGPWR